MGKTLVLMRHARALPAEPGQPDELRPLMPDARLTVAEELPRMLALLNDPQGRPPAHLELWTSPALRTAQTAEEVARALGCAAPAERVSLLCQDIDAFLAEVEACDAPVVVAVGHNPMLEELIERLCGVKLFFTPASVAAVDLEAACTLNGFNACLLWFVQGPRTRHLH